MYGDILDRGRENRQIADYDLSHFDVSAQEARKLTQDAEKFVKKIESILKTRKEK